MGLVISPGSVISQLDSMNENLQQAVSNAEKMLLNVNNFLDTKDSLKGEAYDSIRDYFGAVHIPILNAMILCAEAMIQENNTYKNCISSYLAGVNFIDEDGLKQDKEFLERQIDRAYSLSFVSLPTKMELVSSLEKAKGLIEKELQQINDFMEATAGLYGGMDRYIGVIQSGINVMGKKDVQVMPLEIFNINGPRRNLKGIDTKMIVREMTGNISIDEFEDMLKKYCNVSPEVTYDGLIRYLDSLMLHGYIFESDYKIISNNIIRIKLDRYMYNPALVTEIRDLLRKRKNIPEYVREEFYSLRQKINESDTAAMIELKLIENYIDEILEGKLTIGELQEVADILNNNNPEIAGEIKAAYRDNEDKYKQLLQKIIEPYETVYQYATEDLLHKLEWKYVTDEHVS